MLTRVKCNPYLIHRRDSHSSERILQIVAIIALGFVYLNEVNGIGISTSENYTPTTTIAILSGHKHKDKQRAAHTPN